MSSIAAYMLPMGFAWLAIGPREWDFFRVPSLMMEYGFGVVLGVSVAVAAMFVFFTRRIHSFGFWYALGHIALPVVCSLLDRDTSHSLIAIEWIFYALMATAAIVVSWMTACAVRGLAAYQNEDDD